MTSGYVPVPGGGRAAGPGRPPALDITVANQARMYDYLLGGKDNCAADRAAAEQALRVWPAAGFTARANRAFAGRAVRYLAREAGVRQFLDIGTGIPMAGSTHQVAQAAAPESRVVYVDYDPVVLAHARAMLVGHQAGATEFVDADLRDTTAIVAQAGRTLDFSRPVAVTLTAILNAIPDSDNPAAIVATLMSAVPAGSYLVLTHLGLDLLDPETHRALEGMQDRMMRKRFTSRTREQLARFFEGLDLVEPGLVRAEEWRHRSQPRHSHRSALWCAVARKP
jgi:hypothetical protein